MKKLAFLWVALIAGMAQADPFSHTEESDFYPYTSSGSIITPKYTPMPSYSDAIVPPLTTEWSDSNFAKEIPCTRKQSPYEIHLSCYKYFQVGLRSDGVVVWRKKE